MKIMPEKIEMGRHYRSSTAGGTDRQPIIDTGLRGVHGYQVGEDWHFYQVVKLAMCWFSRSKPIDAIEHHGKTRPPYDRTDHQKTDYGTRRASWFAIAGFMSCVSRAPAG